VGTSIQRLSKDVYKAVKEQKTTLHKKMAVGSKSSAQHAIPWNVTVNSAILALFVSRFCKVDIFKCEGANFIV
jgi:hypothetical protein